LGSESFLQGGSTVDPGGYQWKNGIGDRDLRAPFENTNWGRLDSNDVGVEEFVRFCRAVDAEPLICDTQDRSQIDVINFWDHPDRIKTLPLSVVGSKIVLPALSVSVIECGK
jgi:alpha-L-arabinofuranosidase